MKLKKAMVNLFVVFCALMSFMCFWIFFLLDLNNKYFSPIYAFGGGVMSTLLMLIAFQSRKDIYVQLKTCYVAIQNKLTAQDDYNAIFQAVTKNDILTASHDDIAFAYLGVKSHLIFRSCTFCTLSQIKLIFLDINKNSLFDNIIYENNLPPVIVRKDITK